VISRMTGLFLVGAMALNFGAMAVGGETIAIVKLTVEDEAGLGALKQPMTMGIPLPPGKVSDAGTLVLLDAAGKQIPAGIKEVSRWLDGKSVKWVHATWLQSVAPKGQVQVTLADTGVKAASAKGKIFLKVTKTDAQVTVQTGFVKFSVKGAKFNGFDSAWFDATGKNNYSDANQVIGGDGGGSIVTIAPKDQVKLENENPKFSGAGKPYFSTNDSAAKVEVEEQTPFRVVIKASGQHKSGDQRALDYIVRFYAYADSPLVRVSHTFLSRQGEKVSDFHWMEGLELSVPTKLAGGKLLFGSEAKPVATGLPGRIRQETSDKFSIFSGDNEVASGKGKSSKPLTTGWMDLRKGNLGLAVGIKWFWQMRPKSLGVDSRGGIHVGLYARRVRPLEVYRGQSRTHYMTFLFHNGQAKPESLNALYAAEQKPLRAWATPKYYCRDAPAFGPMLENDKALYGEKWPKVERHNQVMLDSLKGLLKFLDKGSYGKIARDSYGVYAWGDRFHWTWKNFGKSPVKSHQWRQSWAGNYYDYPSSMLLQFLRTGNKLYLERFWPNALQIGDVHTTQWHPKKNLIGACRYCPPRNFVAMDGGKVYTSIEFNHYKSQSVYANWYLTGDLRSLEHCRLLANNAFVNNWADSGWAARGIGSQITGLWNAYELWRDPKYLSRMKKLAGKAMAQFKNGKYRKGGFHDGIANEGLCYYYWVSGDKRVIETFKAGFPKSRNKTKYANMALSLALMYRVTGDEQYKTWAWKALMTKKASARVHNPGCQFRAGSNALYFLNDASKDWKPYTGPQGNGKAPEDL
jgi:PcRGLX-like protein central beta sandwich domain/PcRGLX-like N-terminal RIFT barrel domain